MKRAYICLSCLRLTGDKEHNAINCESCGTKTDMTSYKQALDETKDVVRLGYQYRAKYEKDFELDPKLKGRYYLADLHKIFEFLALAVISGVTGNYAYDQIKQKLKRITSDPLILPIKDDQLKKLLESEEEMDKFILYIEEYRNSRFSTHKKVIEVLYGKEYIPKSDKKTANSYVSKKDVKKVDKSKKQKNTKRKK